MSSIVSLMDKLPQTNVTTYMLKGLDFAVPGQWENITGFDNAVRKITGESDPQVVEEIRQRALTIYNDPSSGYQRAMWYYQLVDKADSALGAAALASKVGEKIGFLSFLNRLTPKPDTAQAVDLSIKLVVELVAFCQIHGLPRDRDGIKEFTGNLGSYSRENLMRMAALVCVDGLIPLGPNFAQKGLDLVKSTGASGVSNNPVFGQLSEAIPGGDNVSKFAFITDSFSAAQGWLDKFRTSHNLTPQNVTSSLQKYIDFSDDKLDYLGAFLDLSTNYYTHTGTQSLARSVITRAAK
jgi:hypothetical protein